MQFTTLEEEHCEKVCLSDLIPNGGEMSLELNIFSNVVSPTQLAMDNARIFGLTFGVDKLP